MASRSFHSLFRQLKHHTKYHSTSLYHHPHHFLFTSSRIKLQQSTSHHQHISCSITPHIHCNPHHIMQHLHHIHNRYHHSSFYHLFNLKSRRIPHLAHNHTQHHITLKRFASMDVSKDYYKTLGVNKNAPKKDIRSAYLKLAKKWHPDLHKNETEKLKARNKFIEIQESYEVLHDDGMRKKYDEMRRYGYSQDQYKHHEAYQKQPGFTNRGANPWENQWEQQFRRNMHHEWEQIRRDQQDWANARRAERHKHADQFPFGAQQQGFQGPFSGFNDFQTQQQMYNPLEGFFRTMIYVFGFFLALRLIGTLMFGNRRHDGPSGYDPFKGPSAYSRSRDKGESPYYSQSSYERYNHKFPPPLSLRQKHDNDNDRLKREDNRKYKAYVPPAPVSHHNRSPNPKNSLRETHKRRESLVDEEDGNKYKFHKPSERQTTDVSSPGSQRRKAKQGRYEKMLEEQRMMEELYIRARKQQQEDMEYKRQRDMNQKFGNHGNRSRVPPAKSGGFNEEEEDVGDAWERYLNSRSGSEVNWRDRGRRSG